MNIDETDVIKVLSLFDKEDIPYINFEYLINNNILEDNDIKRIFNIHVKIKKLGGRDDRTRK